MNGFSDFKVLGERQLTGSERVATRPNRNADGRSIVLSQIFVMRIDGSSRQQLTLADEPFPFLKAEP